MAGTAKTRLWYQTFETEEEAKQYCDKENNPNARSYYMRKHYPARYTETHDRSGEEVYYITWTTY